MERPDTPQDAQLPHDLHSLRSLPDNAAGTPQGRSDTTAALIAEMGDAYRTLASRFDEALALLRTMLDSNDRLRREIGFCSGSCRPIDSDEGQPSE
jgi:hypothetical protein